ncbi:MAG: hypothetical protein DYG98_20970 [Haliscomenobacteraceae bacterium CHB4]|nr:hypothetical protein [Saprospiraceae bacterium]MCE7925532.1 hypothetical protein [Haliscomenobacteraceae bacterium CHB4]
MKEVAHPHDALFKFVLSASESARDMIGLLPWEFTELLDLDTLMEDPNSYISPELKEYMSDKVWHCTIKGHQDLRIDVALLFDHKSFLPEYPHLQLNLYLALKARREELDGQKPTLTIPVILYHGTEKWVKSSATAPFGNYPQRFHPFVPAFDYHLIDLANFTDEDILNMRMGPLVNMLLVFKHFRNKPYLLNNLDKIFVYGDFYQTTEQGRQFIWELLVYFFKITDLRRDEGEKVINQLPKIMQPAARSTYDNIVLESQMEIQHKIAENFIRKYPDWSDDAIAAALLAEIELIRQIRQDLKKRKLIPQ